MPYENSSRKLPTPEEEGSSPLEAERRRSHRFLHLALALMLVIPALLWLLRPPSTGEGEFLGSAEIDEVAPDFTLDLFDGSSFTLTDHLSRDGRSIVMNLWASWCVPCREEMPALDAVARRHPEILMLGVAVQDTEAAAREFAQEVAVSYPLGPDDDGILVELYPTLGLPTTWFITSDGMVAARWTGQLDEDLVEDLIAEHMTG